MTFSAVSSTLRRLRPLALASLALCALGSGAVRADEPFVYMTNWYAQAEHGGFYQALATASM